MIRALDWIVRAGSALLGVMWILAAISKAASPDAAYEFAQRVAGGSEHTRLGLAVVAGGEAFLGVAMLLGATRGLFVSGAAIGSLTILLVRVKSAFGGAVKCGCIAILADASVDEAIVRNVALLAACVALTAAQVLSRRLRRVRDAAAASGPARSGS